MQRGSQKIRPIRLGVLMGGQSSEHEISLLSAASVFLNCDSSRFDTSAVFMDHDGSWWKLDSTKFAECARNQQFKDLKKAANGRPFSFLSKSLANDLAKDFDAVFPVMHGTNCEDGVLQGVLENSGIPYVGAGVLGSSIGMDKEVSKRLAAAAGIPIVPYVLARAGGAWKNLLPSIEKKLGYPVFVKPACLGSSVGVKKAANAQETEAAIQNAFRYDLKVLIEQAIPAREIEISVLEGKNLGDRPRVSTLAEIRPNPKHGFYSYEAKYLDDDGAELLIPAQVDAAKAKEIQQLAQDIFETLELESMARIDFFLDKNNQKIYFNEVNTIPGFTKISMFPKMWAASGLPYTDLITELVELALKRAEGKQKLVRSYY